jgi:hypothetical protein
LETLFKSYIFDRRQLEGAENAGEREAAARLEKRLRLTRKAILKALERDRRWSHG